MVSKTVEYKHGEVSELVSTRNKVLLLGNSPEVLTSLLKSILATPTAQIGDRPVTSPQVVPWILDTRYYTVDLSIWANPLDPDSDEDIQQWSEIGHAVDALLFVFDRSNPDGFERIKPWATFVEEHDPSIALCIAAHKNDFSDRDDDETDTTEDQLDKWNLWCVENGFEFVDTSEKTIHEDEDDGGVDKRGLDRIFEALEANMWEGLRRKNHSKDQAESDSADFHDLVQIENMHKQLFGNWSAKDSEDDEGLGSDPLGATVSRIQELRDLGQKLNLDERRKLAERVMLAFEMEAENEGSDLDGEEGPGGHQLLQDDDDDQLLY
ncbi:hypothetical protein BJ742DRAFT_831459 [Cladochytrium replicatum]|nr:hypothetical protein BJ742DRAFT_831459 [Cladochytrium replicatum]